MSGKRTGRDDDRYRTDGGQEDDLTTLQGIGPARADRLRDAGFDSFEDIRVATRDDLVDVLGPELTDQILEQVGDGDSPTGGETADEPADSGPTVPSAGESGDEGGSPTAETDDSGPSVPTSSGGDSDAGGETAGQTANSTDQSARTGGDAGTPTTGTGGNATVESTAQQGTARGSNDSNEDAILAGLVSFLIPGVGNMINGQTDRGVIILVLWILWLIIGWGIGVFIIGSIIGFLTLGIGFILVSLVVGLLEFLIHVLAAVDAYRGSKVVDNVTGKVNQVRGN